MSAIGGVSGLKSAMPQVSSGASMRMPPAQKMGNLFQKIDTSGSGSISKTQLSQAFKTLNPPPAIKSMGADALFSKLDPKGTGSVSKQDFVNVMKTMATQGHTAPAAQSLAASTNSLNSLGSKPASSPTGALGNNIDIKA
jgi:Ca2+-binding EF-hand superfamily protein